MISGHATVQIAVEAIRLGAYEFIEKPFSKEKIVNYVNRALESASLKKEKDIIENKLFHSFDLVGKSSTIVKVKKIIEKLSTSESRVLISGPTGSGKELVARKIHKNSIRSKEPFVIINAALLKEKTYEKELFGEEFDDGNVSFFFSPFFLFVSCSLAAMSTRVDFYSGAAWSAMPSVAASGLPRRSVS